MRKEQTQKKKKYERRHAHCRLFAALDDAAEPVSVSPLSGGESPHHESERNEPVVAEVHPDQYFVIAKNVIEAQEELSQQGGEVDFQSVLYARKALSLAAKLFAKTNCAPATEECNIWIRRAKQLLNPGVQESASSDSIVLPPRPPARGR